MLQNSEFLVVITRYLNNPEDPDCRLAVANFRKVSTVNEDYFLEIEKVWKLSSAAAALQNFNVENSAKELAASIAPTKKLKSYVWWKSIAAAFVVLALGYWIYGQYTRVVYFTKTTAQNQVDSVRLVDGSVVVLAANSKLKYPNKFGSDREIALLKGQAFFKIAKDPIHPFKVIINKARVIVLGTSFNIRMANAKIHLGVITGKVSFKPDDHSETATLIAGQALSYDILKRSFLASTSQNSNSWLTKELIFVDTPLEDVCKQLTAYYGTEIKLKNNNRNHRKLNAIFKYQTLDQVLEVLNETYNIKINKEHNQINLTTP